MSSKGLVWSGRHAFMIFQRWWVSSMETSRRSPSIISSCTSSSVASDSSMTGWHEGSKRRGIDAAEDTEDDQFKTKSSQHQQLINDWQRFNSSTVDRWISQWSVKINKNLDSQSSLELSFKGFQSMQNQIINCYQNVRKPRLTGSSKIVIRIASTHNFSQMFCSKKI